MSDVNVGTLSATAELKDTLSPGLLRIAQSVDKGVTSLTGWSAAQQRMAMSIAGTYAEALKMDKAFDEAAASLGKWTEADQKAAMAMAAVHDEALKLNAATSNAGKGSQAAVAGLGELEKTAAGLASELGPAGAALTAMGPAGLVAAAGIGAAVVAGGALISFLESAVSKAVAFGSKFQEMSDNSGVGASKLSLIAGSEGIGDEGVETFTSGVKKLNMELLKSPEQFEQLGLSVKGLLAMQPEERFAATAAAILELGSDAERSAASQELLGRSMPIALLRDFADIQEKMGRSEKLGLGIDDAAAASLKALDDEAKVLSKTWEALMINLGTTIATTPGVVEGIRSITGAFGEANQFIRENKQTIQDLVSLAVPLLQKLSGEVKNYVQYLKDAKNFGIRLSGGEVMSPEKEAWARGVLDKAYKDKAREEATAGSGLTQNSAKVLTFDPNRGAKAKAAKAEADRIEKEAQALKEKLDKQTLEMAESMDEARLKYEALWTSMAGLSSQQVEAELGKVAELFRSKLAAGAEVSTEQLEKLRQKMLELQRLSPEAFNKAFENNPAVAALMAATANVPGNFVKPGQGISREGLEDTAAGNADRKLGGLGKTQREQEEAALELARKLHTVSDGLTRFGNTIGGVTGSLFRAGGALVDVIGSVKQFQASGGWGGMSGQQKLEGAANALGAAGQIWQQNKHNMSAGNAALSGAGAGAKEGAKYGGVAGAVIGGVAGAAIAVLSGAGFRKMAKEAGKVLGGEVSKELAIAIEATKKQLKVGTKEASLLNLSKAMEESGRAASTYTPQISELIKGIADKSIPATEGMEELGRAFGAVAEEASKSKVASQAMFAVMKQARESKVMTDDMKQAITAAVEANAQLTPKAFGQLGKVKGDDGQEHDGAVGGLQILTPEQAAANAEIFGLVWGSTVAEKGLTEASRLLQPGFEALQSRLAQHSEGFNQAAQAIFAPVQQQFSLGMNEAFASSADAAVAFGGMLKNAINTAMPMTIEQFNAFGTTAAQAFEQARQAALEVGLTAGEASKQALLATTPLLQQQVAAAEAYGFELDEQSKLLVENAKASGIAFATSPVDRMSEGVDRMVVALEKLAGITPKVADGFRSIGSAASTIPTGLDIGDRRGIAEGENPGGGIPGLATGGIVYPRPGGTIVRLAEAGVPEMVTPLARGGGSSGMGGVIQFGNIYLQQLPSEDGAAMANRFIDTLRNSGDLQDAIRRVAA